MISRFAKLKEKEKIDNMTSCNHLYIIGEEVEEWISEEFKMIPAHYCVKCELDTIYHLHRFPRSLLTKSEKRMWNIYQQTMEKSTFIDKVCEPKVAQAIYEKIKRKNPNITSEVFISYFKEAIQEENQISKVKQKSLGQMTK